MNEEKTYPQYIMQSVRINLGLKGIDKSKDKIIMKMEKREVFERYLQWNNLIGWGNSILDAVENIFDVQLGE